jgi:hypothetical protein
LKKRKDNAKCYLNNVRSRLFEAKQGRSSGRKNRLSQTCLSILEIFGIFGILEIRLEMLNL